MKKRKDFSAPAPGAAGRGYEWEVYSDNNLRLWPAGSEVVYFSHKDRAAVSPPSAWKRLGTSFSMPAPAPFDPWRAYAIPLIGSARHSRGYYHSRINDSFYDFLLVSGGVLVAKFGGKSVELRRGEALVVPPGKLCDNCVKNSGARLYWAHMEKIPYWEELFGEDVTVKRLAAAEEIFALMHACWLEAYSERRSASILALLAEAAVSALRREFRRPCAARLPDSELEALAAEIRKFPGRRWSVSERARALGVSVRALNGRFLKLYLRSFHKYVLDRRMEAALRHLKSGGLSCSRIAEKVGYANAHSFSKAFFAYYGAYPGEAREELAAP